MDMKERSSQYHMVGTNKSPTGRVRSYDLNDHKVYHQRTYSEDNPLFLFMRNKDNLKGMPSYWVDFMSRQDLGSAFRTEKGSIESSLQDFYLAGDYFGGWYWKNSGPVFPVGLKSPLALATSQEVMNQEQLLFALGGAAINRTRPGKPQVDLAVALGELRQGVPSLIGSLWARARTAKDLFRESGNEYLNLQFGWAPLTRDIQHLAEVVLDTRRLLQGHEKKLNKLLKRSYSFGTERNTGSGLTMTLASYELEPVPGYSSQVGTGTQLSYQVPIETFRQVTTSHFSAGYRFFYPEIDTALNDLVEFEHQANVLLGTRLDPEVLWNLAPWSWLVDWFINFGDVLGNLSAIISDGLVMQYGYIMQEISLVKEIYYPRGLMVTNYPSGNTFTNKPWHVIAEYHSKTRVRASPFGFGLTPEMFSPQQWAILAALGITRGLK